MGDGKEGERQPLLKNENVTYSSHGSDAIGTYQDARYTVTGTRRLSRVCQGASPSRGAPSSLTVG